MKLYYFHRTLTHKLKYFTIEDILISCIYIIYIYIYPYAWCEPVTKHHNQGVPAQSKSCEFVTVKALKITNFHMGQFIQCMSSPNKQSTG